MEYKCNNCKNDFESKKGCRSRTPKYCSKKCYAQSIFKLKSCPVCSKHYPSDPNTKYCSVGCYKKGRPSRKNIPLSEEHKKALSQGRRKSDKCKGENLYNWKGGKETQSERMKIASHKRRSLQKILIDNEFLKRLLIVQKNKCFFCECDLTNYKAIEHLTPLSKGGDNQKYNLVYSCKGCNSKKRSKTLEEFAIQTGNINWINKFDLIFSNAI